MDRDDVSLLEAWQGGDAQAGQELFKRHWDSVYGFFRTKVADVAGDLTQDTFLACVRDAADFRRDGEFKSFVFGIAWNKLRDHLRRRSRNGAAFDTGVTSVHDLAPSPSSLAAAHDEQTILVEALRRLPIDQQVALELHYWEAMTAPQIAAIVDAPVGTVASRLRLGRAALAEHMRLLGARASPPPVP